MTAATLLGTDAGNYTLTGSNSTTTADITAKGITGTITAANKVYDGNTVASTSGVLSGVVAGDTVTLTSTGDFTDKNAATGKTCLLYTSPSPRDQRGSRMPSSA